MKQTKLILLGIVTAIILLLVLAVIAHGSVDKITWCHVEPNGNSETLHLPLAALTQAGHVDANGNPLHAGDHAGECISPTLTPTPGDISPTKTPEVSITPGVSVTPTDTPLRTDLSDNKSDGRSDGLSSCPKCTQAPNARSPYDGQPVGWK